jgi:hypothetical protein
LNETGEEFKIATRCFFYQGHGPFRSVRPLCEKRTACDDFSESARVDVFLIAASLSVIGNSAN